LQQHVASYEATAETILKDVHGFSAPAPLRDDASVIVVKLEVQQD
jgi:hypothetical protein